MARILRGYGHALVVAAGVLLAGACRDDAVQSTPALTPQVSSKEKAATNSTGRSVAGVDSSTLEVARAVMVTVELDFGSSVPTISDALQQIERRSKPDTGTGRTFAILDAYGQPTADGKLHMSMHVSTEKPGDAALVFKRTGETLWRSRIIQGTNAAAGQVPNRGLVVLVDNGAGQTVTVDGSNNPRSVLDAKVKEMAATVADIWPEGSEREVTFLYSACGCPVKVMAVRAGDRTLRTRELPVIFPDDPAVVTVIKRIMRWE